MSAMNLASRGNGHSRCVDDSAADHIEHISMVKLRIHTPTARRKRFQQANSRAMDISRKKGDSQPLEHRQVLQLLNESIPLFLVTSRRPMVIQICVQRLSVKFHIVLNQGVHEPSCGTLSDTVSKILYVRHAPRVRVPC